MTLEITDEERLLLEEVLDSAIAASIQGVDHADARSFKEALRRRIDQLESLRRKLEGERTLRDV